ncbi:PREDICTED: uncharacterized protein LOC104810743 [Tarenaya hassleriana]|uniref:uncharacterized protein LOC104810743 n=1 Tax=Tarenaya hassleriana TaxID=28532 RepID=UPI00053C2FDC|nr:PREDICTED: uncharacterized protein LOC104810743 [Tarenaya hassleriana]
MEAIELHDTDSLPLSFGSSAIGHVDLGSEPGSPSGFYPTKQNPVAQQTEGDDDEYIAELTRRMANDMLQDDDKHEKSWGGSGSPQSTLWSPFGYGSVSPIGPSREPSPPLTLATEKFEKMKTNAEMNPLLIPFPSKEALIDIQIRSAQANFRKTKEEREQKEKREQKNRNDGVYGNRARATPKHYRGKSSGHGGNYHRNGSGVKAVFPDGSGPRPGSCGTGVFLPRGTGTGTSTGTVLESRKKTGCPTVIIPARVVEAVKSHFDKLALPSDFPPHHGNQTDAFLMAMDNNNKNVLPRPKKSYAEVVSARSRRGTPLDLPPEWTY